MNLAIIIGVSEYVDSQNNLPGCKKDADSINNILNKTSKYDEVLFINEKISSGKVKERLTDFISEHKTKKVDELLFYYTGHGEFVSDEFYYILSDYQEAKRKQTTLQNEEIDNLFRTLNPDLVVKIIDACQSGKSYIKEAGAVTKYFQKTIDRFNRCYFLNSSLKDQSSFQTDVISDFTLSFIKSLKEHDTAEIRYKDIIDYISDEFENNQFQTPFFVVQADYTEKFCEINPLLKKYLENLDSTIDFKTTKKENKVSLIDKIRKEATDYFTKEQALSLLNELKEDIIEFKLEDELNEIYDLQITFQENYDGIINKSIIGKWLDDNPHDYFAKSTRIKERKDRNTSILGGIRTTALWNPLTDEADYEWVRNGFELELEVPYKSIFITLNSNFPNVDSLTSRVVYLLSRKQIRLFYFITNFEMKNWDERKINSKIEWFTTEYLLKDKDSIVVGLRKILTQMEENATKELDEKFNKKEITKD